MYALGFTNYWDTHFAGRAAPLGSSVPATVVHALFYNFAPGEVARHLTKVLEHDHTAGRDRRPSPRLLE